MVREGLYDDQPGTAGKTLMRTSHGDKQQRTLDEFGSIGVVARVFYGLRLCQRVQLG